LNFSKLLAFQTLTLTSETYLSLGLGRDKRSFELEMSLVLTTHIIITSAILLYSL